MNTHVLSVYHAHNFLRSTSYYSPHIRIRIRIRIRILLLAHWNLLWDILRLPSSHSNRAALGLYVILTLWRAQGTNQPPYALLHTGACHATHYATGDDYTITNLVLELILLSLFCIVSSLGIIQLFLSTAYAIHKSVFLFFVPPGTYYCRVDRSHSMKGLPDTSRYDKHMTNWSFSSMVTKRKWHKNLQVRSAPE